MNWLTLVKLGKTKVIHLALRHNVYQNVFGLFYQRGGYFKACSVIYKAIKTSPANFSTKYYGTMSAETSKQYSRLSTLLSYNSFEPAIGAAIASAKVWKRNQYIYRNITNKLRITEYQPKNQSFATIDAAGRVFINQIG